MDRNRKETLPGCEVDTVYLNKIKKKEFFLYISLTKFLPVWIRRRMFCTASYVMGIKCINTGSNGVL